MPAKFCTQCGQEISAAAKFCPNCATPVGNPQITGSVTAYGAQATMRSVSADPSKRLGIILGSALGALLILAVVVLMVKSHQRSLLEGQTNVSTAPSLTTAPTVPISAPTLTAAPSQPAEAPSLTSAPSKPSSSPNLTSATTTPPGVLPPDVAQYLKFLQGVEQQRVAITNDMAGASSMLAIAKGMQGAQNIDPTDDSAAPPPGSQPKQKVNSGFADYSAKFQTLARDFSQVRPPQPCSAVANSYGTFLSDYVATISKLQVSLVKGDIGGAMAMQGEQRQITTNGIAADTDLSGVYSRYGVPKAFSIQPEGASPSLISP